MHPLIRAFFFFALLLFSEAANVTICKERAKIDCNSIQVMQDCQNLTSSDGRPYLSGFTDGTVCTIWSETGCNGDGHTIDGTGWITFPTIVTSVTCPVNSTTSSVQKMPAFSGLSKGAIAGIVIGTVIGAAILAGFALVAWFMFHRKPPLRSIESEGANAKFEKVTVPHSVTSKGALPELNSSHRVMELDSSNEVAELPQWQR